MIRGGKNEEGRRAARHPFCPGGRTADGRGVAEAAAGSNGAWAGQAGRYVLAEMFVFVPLLKE